MNSIYKNKVLSVILSLLLSLLSPFVFSSSVFAAISASVSLSPSPSTVVVQGTTTVTITVNTGATKSDGGEVRINYDKTKLRFDSINYTGSPFNSDSPEANATSEMSSNTGTLIVSRYTNTPPGPAGSILFGKITFTALVSTGSSPITINQAASYFNDDAPAAGDPSDAPPTSVSNTSINFRAPDPAPVIDTTAKDAGTTTTTNTTKTNTPTKVKTPTKATTVPSTVTTPIVVSDDSTNVPTTPDGMPVASMPIKTKFNKKLVSIGIGTLATVLVFAAILTFIRKRSMMGIVGGSSHEILSMPKAPSLPADAPLNKIPSVATRAPGEVIQPQSNNHTPPPPVG